MTKMILALVTFASASAFAQKFNCDILQNKSGTSIMGGPSFAVIDNGGEDVRLEVTNFDSGKVSKPIELPMTKQPGPTTEVSKFREKTYQVTAVLMAPPHASVDITQRLEGETYSAHCSPAK